MSLADPRQRKAEASGDHEARDLSIFAGLLFLPLGLHLPYFPVWLAARGLTAEEIAAAIATPLIARVIATPLIAAFADKRGVGLAVTACALTVFATYCALRFGSGFALIFAGAVLVSVAMGSMPALADALTLSEIRRAETDGRPPIAYGHIRVWTSIGVLATMLASAAIVEALPGEQIIVALILLSLPSVGAALFAAIRMNRAHLYAGATAGRLTADSARLRLALLTIAAAALIQASHAEVYAFGTIQWRAAGLSPGAIGAAWAVGVGAEILIFLLAARHFRSERSAVPLLLLGAAGAALRWTAMSFAPGAEAVIALQTLHAFSFGATTCGSVLLLGALASPTHRARMQGWLAAAGALSLAAATYGSGWLTARFGDEAYLAMAALAVTGGAIALAAGWLKRGLQITG
ncbi:major facilitator superfamily MFS_1 [Methylocella silvestris BL2]|uniref:Major facilitator superfamily MFS_1 n=1 Tax=Methylocella silvestris (strain DSM 15510 / CIP 108128 / LMG 27833 / NCIMB 13906 / BL2) TaxID=395965 RepID=B8EJX1_METSB|nr:MFS transporter [Methylocella silvestris]ACK49918.1 major facilitator superfamily MFS_1 [Methylocella silvestris BL2]